VRTSKSSIRRILETKEFVLVAESLWYAFSVFGISRLVPTEAEALGDFVPSRTRLGAILRRAFQKPECDF
jgi:hypothetical protein